MSILNKEKILEQARLFIQEGRYDKAIKEYEKIAIADPEDMRVKLRIAELHVKRKQVGEAIKVYGEVASQYSHDGFYLKAVTVYKNILRLNPSLIEVNENLAQLYEKMGLLQDAIRQYEIFASAIEHKGEFKRLLEIRKKIVELKPDDGDARVRLAEMYQREGRGEEALDQYEEYARRLESQGGDESRLIEMYEKVLSHRGDREDMLRSLIRIYYRKGEIKKALKWLEFAKVLTSVDTELLGMQAEIYSRLNQMETARSKYLTLSDLHHEKGNVEGMVDALARIAALIPSEEERVQKRLEDIEPSAVKKLKSRLEELKEEQRVVEEEGEAEEAIPKQAERPKEKKPETKPEPEKDWDKTVIVPVKPSVPAPEKLRLAKSAYELALYYKQIGLKEEAAKELAKAEQLYSELAPSSPDATKRLAEIYQMMGKKPPPPKQKKPKAKESGGKKKRKVSFV